MSFSSSSWYAKNLNLSEHCVVLFGIVLFLRKEPRGRMPSSPSPSSSACRAPTSAWPAPGSGPSARRAQSESDPIRVAGPSPQAPPCRPRSLVCRRQPRRHSSPFPFNPPSRRTPPPPFPFNPPSRLRRTPPRTRRDGRCLPTCTYIPPPPPSNGPVWASPEDDAPSTRVYSDDSDTAVTQASRYSSDTAMTPTQRRLSAARLSAAPAHHMGRGAAAREAPGPAGRSSTTAPPPWAMAAAAAHGPSGPGGPCLRGRTRPAGPGGDSAGPPGSSPSADECIYGAASKLRPSPDCGCRPPACAPL